MKSKAIILGAIRDCWRVPALLFGAVACLEMPAFWTSLIVSVSKRPLHPAYNTILTLVSLSVALLLFTVFLYKRSILTAIDLGHKRLSENIRGLAGIVFSFLVLLILMILSWLAMSNLYLIVTTVVIRQPDLLIPLYIGFVMAAFVLAFLVMAGLASFFVSGLYQSNPSSYPRIYLRTLIELFRRFPAALAMMAALAAGIFLFRILDRRIVGLLDYVFYDSLASRLVYILLASALEALILGFVILLVERLLAGVLKKQTHQDGLPARMNRTSRLLGQIVPPAAAAAVLVALSLILLPQYGDDNANAYHNIVLTHSETGDMMLMDPNQLDLSSFNYRRAYSMVLSFEGYIKTILAGQDPDKVELRNDALQDFDAATAYDTGNPYSYLFRGYWYECGGNTSDALWFYRISRDLLPTLTDAGFACSRLEGETDDLDSRKQSIDTIIYLGNYTTNFEKFKSYPEKRLADLLETYEETRAWLFDRLAVSALEKYRMNDARGMYEDISVLVNAEPDNPNILLLQAIAAIAYRPETANYAAAETAIGKLSGLVAENDKVLELYGVIMMTAKNYEKAADLYGSLFARYPDNNILGEQYAYALLAGSQDDDAIAVCEAVLDEYPDDWLCHYVMATARLKSGQYRDSLDSIRRFVDTADLDVYASSRDMFLNAYCLAYSLHTMVPEAMVALDGLPAGSFLEHYILGITAWRDRDLPLALDEIKQVIDDEPDLGMAWFLKASALFEQSRQDVDVNLSELESDFTRAAALQPYSIEIWFSLGNFYKAWGDHDAQALRAYRRVIDLEPYSDHSHDYYGVTYHALIEIDRLEETEWLGEEA